MNRNNLKTVILLGLLGGLCLGIGAFWGEQGLIIGLVIGLLFVGASYWFSDSVAIKAARAVPVSEAQMPQYYEIVRDLTTRAGLPMPAPLRLALSRNQTRSLRDVTPSTRRWP